MSNEEVKKCFANANKTYTNYEISSMLYYKSYLKNILGSEYETSDIADIFKKLESLRELVNFRVYRVDTEASLCVKAVLSLNNYFAKNTNRSDVTVKMFSTFYDNKQCVVKTYLFDNNCVSLKWSLEQKLKNEILFQLYAKTLNKTVDFISPELYTWGSIYKYKHANSMDAEYKVMYLIMEYIPFMTLKQSIQTLSYTKDIYEKIDHIDVKMKRHLLCHNDLHNLNILVSPLPKIYIIDFGESSCGPIRTIR